MKRATHDGRLSVEQWRAAALEALAEGGVSAVAVEPLAKRLGVTKGSGYWHFKDRAALLLATLDEWEKRTTDGVIARLLSIASPRERLTRLFREAFNRTLDSRVYLGLAAAQDQPVVSAALKRVAKRRIAFLAEQYRALGYDEATVRHRAVAAYAAYLGVVALQGHAASVIPARDRNALAEHMIGMLV